MAESTPFEVALITCDSNTHSFNDAICTSFQSSQSAVPQGVAVSAQLNEEVTFSCRAVQELGALRKRITSSASAFLRNLDARPRLSQQIQQAEFLVNLRNFPYVRRRALVRVEVPGEVFAESSEGIVDVVVLAGSRSARMTVAARGIKTVVQRGMIVSKTKRSLSIEIPLDTTALCYSRRIFIWSQTYISNSIVFGFEVTWEGLIESINSVPSLGATR